MKLDRRLNLVVPVDSDGATIYVHAAPIAEQVFDRYFMAIAKTFNTIYGEGLGVIAGPRVAAKILRKVAIDLGEWDDQKDTAGNVTAIGIENGLMAEIRRLANIIAPGPKGWAASPLQDAITHGTISAEDASEVENALVFFTVASSMHKRAELPAILNGVSKIWDAQTASLNCTGFASSLETSTVTANTGEKAIPSSIPG